jgi:hypothetical protein
VRGAPGKKSLAVETALLSGTSVERIKLPDLAADAAELRKRNHRSGPEMQPLRGIIEK